MTRLRPALPLQYPFLEEEFLFFRTLLKLTEDHFEFDTLDACFNVHINVCLTFIELIDLVNIQARGDGWFIFIIEGYHVLHGYRQSKQAYKAREIIEHDFKIQVLDWVISCK